MNEAEAIERLRKFATDPAARGLADDVALFDGLVITHDTIAEGVHFRTGDPAGRRLKLVAVNCPTSPPKPTPSARFVADMSRATLGTRLYRRIRRPCHLRPALIGATVACGGPARVG